MQRINSNTHFGSEYESYDERSTAIDDARLPIGGDLVAEALKRFGPKERAIKVLDVGCGIGLYAKTLLQAGVSEFVGLDASSRRLDAARERGRVLNIAEGQSYWTMQADARALPLDDHRFDGVLMLWVLHHLDKEILEADRESPGALQALREAKRVLSTDGVLVVGTTFPHQLIPDDGGCWYYRYFPEAARRLALRFMTQGELEFALEASGFELKECVVIPEVQYALRSLDPSAPFDRTFRDSDSLFACCDEEELSRGLEALHRDILSGEVAFHIASSVEMLRSIGQGVIVMATPTERTANLGVR